MRRLSIWKMQAMIEQSAEQRISAKLDHIMNLLRTRKGYNVTINFLDAFGCYVVTVKYETFTKLVSPGRHLETQLDWVISYMELDLLDVP